MSNKTLYKFKTVENACLTCKSYDGKIFDTQNIVPVHPNCKCVLEEFSENSISYTEHTKYFKDKTKGNDEAKAMENDKIFNKIVEKALKNEGEKTNFGISTKAYPKENKDILTKERAKYLYYKDYYSKLGLNKVDDRIRGQLFDNSVNQGRMGMAKNIQGTWL